MADGVEIYVRPGGRGVLMMIQLPDDVDRQQFVEKATSRDAAPDLGMHLELSVLPDWCTDPDVRSEVERIGHIHVRVPVEWLSL